MAPLLEVKDLQTYFFGFRGTRVVKAVDGVSFTLEEGETMGLVGESGCGKTTTCHAIVRVLPGSARIVGGSVELEGEDLVTKRASEMREIRGRQIAYILQDPMASLDPLFSVYDQVAEPAYYHRSLRRGALKDRVINLLSLVRIPSPEVRMKEFPHQMSGGMRQRIVGAIAQAGGPKVIIADEPTTNLDVTIQLQYLNLLKELQQQTGVALIFVTHDLGIIAKMCDKVAVMYAGKIVELQSCRGVFLRTETPLHEGTDGLHPQAGQQGAPLCHSGVASRPFGPSTGMQLQPSLPAGPREMLPGRAFGRGHDYSVRRSLLVSDPGGIAIWPRLKPC